MTEHLPECNYDKNPEGNVCICERLRACEKRVLEGRPDPGISEKQAIANHAIYQNGYEQGQGDAAAAAVQRIEILWGFTDVHGQMGKRGVKWVDLNLAIARIELKGISNG